MNRFFAALSAFSLSIAPALAGGIDSDLPSYLFKAKQGKPVEFQRRAPNLEEMIQRTDFPYAQLQPIPLKGVKIQGLQPKSVDTLGWNYFIVVDNSKYSKMSEIYRDSRLNGKSNFVTADSIIHPYLAFTNRVFADAITIQMVPDMLLLLDSMQQVCIADYKASEDREVREDIERNIAYIAVAMKLLNPHCEVPQVGNAPKLAEADLRNVFGGRFAHSEIFDRGEDFSLFKPTGFFLSDEKLQSYFRCREWLSRVPYPIVDSSANSDGHVSNNFRRSVLLFRALDQSMVLGKPSMELWDKLVKASTLIGTPLDNLKERTLYPQDYKLVFQGSSSDLKVTLNALAEPLFRTKLMLAIRKHKPVNLNSASIFELEDGGGDSGAAANFRLFPIVAQPEQPWLRAVARLFPSDKQASSSWPVALLDMYAWGSPSAGNVISDNMFALDPAIAQAMPELALCVQRRQPGGQTTQVDSRSWKLLSAYFKPAPEGTPGVLRSEAWMAHHLLSAAGGWVDSQCAICPEKVPDATPDPAAAAGAAPANGQESATGEGVTGVPTSADAPPMVRRISKTVPYHYLEPSVELYKTLEQDANRIMNDLTVSRYLPDKYKTRFTDFTRLFQRLQKIAELEIRGAQLPIVDKKLLGGIDKILDRVDTPLPAVLPFEAPQRVASSKGKPEDRMQGGLSVGMNMAVGRPGQLYVIYQNPHSMEWTLGRGAVYTYYELPAPLLTTSMWEHRIEAGFAQPVSWTSKFQVVQKEIEHRPAATAAR
jgi:hypothetical protein